MLLLLHKTLKGSRNIQGFALIRAVLLKFKGRVFVFKYSSLRILKFQKKILPRKNDEFQLSLSKNIQV